MPRLISRDKFPPGGGFQVLHAETGMAKPFTGSFREAVRFELEFRRSNPSIAQRLNLPVDQNAVESWVDEQNAIRCLSHGWLEYVDVNSAPPSMLNDAQKKSLYGRVAAVVGKGRAAMSAYTSMFGTEGPVARDLAERRAEVCVGCPQNDKKTGFQDYFAAGAATAIMGILGALKDLNHKTSHDGELGICKACDCPLRAKIFVSNKNIVKNMPEEVWPKLERDKVRCWVLSESGRE